jgi:hypothetical protein
MMAGRMAIGVVLAGLVWSPLHAADWGPTVIDGSQGGPVEEPRAPAPYYVVDQGAQYFSGPGIIIARPYLLDTDVRRHYPFVGIAGPDLIVSPGHDSGRPTRREPVLRRLAAKPAVTRLAGIDRALATGSVQARSVRTTRGRARHTRREEGGHRRY